MNASQTMRSLLATSGIFLEETPAIAHRDVKPENVAPIDREAIREILLERGAPMRDLDWLVASAPSMEHALTFEPTPWMLRGADFTGYLDERPSAAKGRP